MLEKTIEIVSWLIAILLFYFLIPKSKRFEAVLSIFVMQMFTWPLGFIVAELKLISYPSRFFEYATTASFTFEYFVFPVVSALFNQYYPKNSSYIKVFLYTSVIVSLITIGEFILEIYTDNINYINWDWYWSWLSMFVLLHIAYQFFTRLIGQRQ